MVYVNPSSCHSQVQNEPVFLWHTVEDVKHATRVEVGKACVEEQNHGALGVDRDYVLIVDARYIAVR